MTRDTLAHMIALCLFSVIAAGCASIPARLAADQRTLVRVGEVVALSILPNLELDGSDLDGVGRT